MKFKYKVNDIVYDDFDKEYYRIDKVEYQALPRESGYWITMLCETTIELMYRTQIFHPIEMEHHLTLATEMEIVLYARF